MGQLKKKKKKAFDIQLEDWFAKKKFQVRRGSDRGKLARRSKIEKSFPTYFSKKGKFY